MRRFAFVLLALAAFPARAAETLYAEQGCQAVVENDKFSSFQRTDQWYTNGLRLVCMPRDPWWNPVEQPTTKLLRFWKDAQPSRIGFVLGHTIYTPREITVAEPQPNDRPWGGYVYFGAVAQWNDAKNQHTAEIDLGVVGPASGAESLQTRWHQIIGAPAPEGWDNQLRNEPALQLNYRYERLIPLVDDARVELIPVIGGALGNVFVNAFAGATLRAGWRVPGFTTPKVQDDLFFQDAYFIGRVEGKLVAHNLFLDGNTFHDGGPSIDKRYAVGQTGIGFSTKMRYWRLTYIHNRRSGEFRSLPESPRGQQRFGTLVISCEYERDLGDCFVPRSWSFAP